MRDWTGWIVVGLALLAGLASPGAAQANEIATVRLRERMKSGVLRWGGDAEGGAPFVLRDPHDLNRVIGFEVELADELAAYLSRKLSMPIRAEFVQYEWGTLLPGLNKQDFDIILNGYEIIPANIGLVLYSRPYYVYTEQLVVRHDDERIHSLDDCLDKEVGTLAGTAADRLLQAEGVKKIVGFSGQVEPYLDLELGRLDAVLLDTPIVTYYAAPNPKLKNAGPPIGKGFYGIGLRLDDADLCEALNAGLDELMISGRLQQIYRKWHLWDDDQFALAQGPEKDAEAKGLGFQPDGQPLKETSAEPTDTVDRNMIAASAQLWTFDKYAPVLISAAGMTVFLTICSMGVAMVMGLVVALSRLFGPPPLKALALAYVEVFRGMPLLLVLFFLYYGLPNYGIEMDKVLTAIVGFGLTYAAYEAEIYRSAINSVGTGQWEAARALGMPEALAFRRIIFPQAFRTALGPMTNDFVALFKDTSLVSVIAVRELTKEYLILSRSSLKFVELGLLTAVLYLAMSIPLGYLSRYLESRWGSGK